MISPSVVILAGKAKFVFVKDKKQKTYLFFWQHVLKNYSNENPLQKKQVPRFLVSSYECRISRTPRNYPSTRNYSATVRAGVAVPLAALASAEGMPPLLTHTSLVLHNW